MNARNFLQEDSAIATAAELQKPFITRSILGVNVAVSSYEEVAQRSLLWCRERQSRALFFANVHMIMEAVDDPAFLARLNAADMVNPDGMPVVWALRALGEQSAKRVYGPEATAILLAEAEKAGVSVGFYGGSQSTLDALVAVVHQRHPALNVVYVESPPFRALTPDEDQKIVERIAASGVQLLFVGLGCPKQENWVIEHRGRVPAVMFAVGAAFDFIAGSKRCAPVWMQRSGLEWVFRLASEPRRLFWRYFKHNPRFVFLFLWQLIAGNV
jgi:N-acetylglucosaminyldiphosphoundecaprenol N-acetyl-beta-D-mannosaminyltransferase